MKKADEVQRFLFEHAPICGEIVKLETSWQQVIQGRNYPAVLQKLLGQFTAAAILLSSTIKFDGSLILQAQTSGPISLLVAEATSARNIRATAKWKKKLLAEDLQTLFNGGNLVITISSKNGKEKYQGIVELVGDKISTVLEHYMEKSEQLPTHIWLTANGEYASGLLLQKVPGTEGDDTDMWNRIVQLASTIKDDELLNLASKEILHRLFHEETLRVFDPERITFNCSCTREKVIRTLRMLGHKEVHSILAEKEKIQVNCEYCNQEYVFDKVDAEQLFASATLEKTSQTKH